MRKSARSQLEDRGKRFGKQAERQRHPHGFRREIKEHVAQIIARLDHKFLNELDYFEDGNPFFREHRLVHRHGIAEANRRSVEIRGFTRVTAWESDDASASYIPEG